MALFQRGDFILHSGARSRWKIECDVLTQEDWRTLAEIAARKVGDFKEVISLGGAADWFGTFLDEHRKDRGPTLICDDVLTTGESMEDAREQAQRSPYLSSGGIIGVVVFARGKCPDWVIPLFQFTGE